MTRMIAPYGSSADRRRLRRPAAVAGLALVLLTGCSSSAGAGGSASGPRPDEETRRLISAGLRADGRREEARVVTLGGSRLTPVEAPALRDWTIYRVEYRQGPHPVLLHVAAGDGQADLLTGSPKAFAKVMAADAGTVADAGAAAALARIYVETTRPGGILTYVVGRVEDIKFRPGIAGDDARHRDEIVAEYRSRIKAPAAVADGEGYDATVYAVRDKALQRHDIAVSANGAVKDDVTTLVSDLPVPYTL